MPGFGSWLCHFHGGVLGQLCSEFHLFHLQTGGDNLASESCLGILLGTPC